MATYNLPKLPNFFKNRVFLGVLCLIIAGGLIGFFAFVAALNYFPIETQFFLHQFKVPKFEFKKIKETKGFLEIGG